MKRLALLTLLTLLLALACTSDQSTDPTSPPERDTTVAPSTSGGACLDCPNGRQGPGRGLDPLAQPNPTYPAPDPFVGTYLNDPIQEGFDRQLTIDSTGPNRYRVAFLATELDGSLLCRHEAGFERRDTFELVGRIEGSTLRIRSSEAALHVLPEDADLLRNPGLLCPGASIFGWWLPQWTRGEAFPDTLALPSRDEWVAPDFLRDFNAAMRAVGQPALALRYETEILTRGDFDADGTWEYPILLRDDAGRLSLFLYQPADTPDRLRRVAALNEKTSGEPARYVGCGLDTEPAGTAFYDWSTQQRFTLPGPGIVLQYYEAATVVFYLQGDRWRMVQVAE